MDKIPHSQPPSSTADLIPVVRSWTNILSAVWKRKMHILAIGGLGMTGVCLCPRECVWVGADSECAGRRHCPCMQIILMYNQGCKCYREDHCHWLVSRVLGAENREAPGFADSIPKACPPMSRPIPPLPKTTVRGLMVQSLTNRR